MRAMLKEKLKNENGAAQIIEMTLIFPLVLLVMGFLIYVASFMMETVSIYTNSQKVAVAACRQMAYPGYEYLYQGGGITSKVDFNMADGAVPGKAVIEAMMQVHDPYRYWVSGDKLLDPSEVDSLENSLEKLIEDSSLVVSGDVECTITTENNFLNQEVKVRAVKKIKVPSFVTYFGINDIVTIDVTATAVSNDPAEFIRNTDMVFDLATDIWENFKFGDKNQSMSERVATFKQKITDARSKLGLGM